MTGVVGHPLPLASKKTRLVLADDHPVVLRGLAQMFRLEPGFAVVDAVTDGAAAIRSVLEHLPDVLVLDVRMPGKNGLAVLRELRRASVPTRVVLLTAVLDEAELEEALRHGADGIAFKDASPRVLVECVKRVASGARWLDLGSYLRGLDSLRLQSSSSRRR
jgi:DNA-binding NarL/FixJ family response regulator